MKEAHQFSIASFVDQYFDFNLPKREAEVLCLSLNDKGKIAIEGSCIHFYMIILGVKGKTKIKVGSHEFLIKSNSITVIPAESWISLETPQDTFEAKVILFEQSF